MDGAHSDIPPTAYYGGPRDLSITIVQPQNHDSHLQVSKVAAAEWKFGVRKIPNPSCLNTLKWRPQKHSHANHARHSGIVVRKASLMLDI